MRYELRTKHKVEGNTRVITKFLWLPKIINHEFRWLERGCYGQKVYLRQTRRKDSSEVYERLVWVDEHWI